MKDLTLDADECESFVSAIEKENPPPDKVPKLRSMAFRIASQEYLEECSDILSLLKCLNAIVHAIELTCLVPKKECEEVSEDDFNQIDFLEMYQKVMEDRAISFSEGQQVQNFFRSHPVPKSNLISARAQIFKIAIEYFCEGQTERNKRLLECIDVIIYYFEEAYLQAKPYNLESAPLGEVSGMSLSKAVQTLYDLDINRLEPGEDYGINVQGGKMVGWDEDKARQPLFAFVNQHELSSRPTYKYFVALLNNYSSRTGENEAVTRQETVENWSFINAIMETAPMQFCHKYLVSNAKDVPKDLESFKKMLYKLWFEMYSRSRGSEADSSGFEHVFVGEIKNGKISGFHNWVQYYLEEQKGNIDYRGFILPRNKGDAAINNDDRVLTIQFLWHEVEKSVGSTLIGVSPEFEVALYTLCFCMGKEHNSVELKTGNDIFDLTINCYRYGDHIGTSYPEARAHFEA